MSNTFKWNELLGSLCEVLTQENRMLFAGVIQGYDPSTAQLRVDLYRGDATPQGILHQTEVKLRVLSSRHADQVALLYARVKGCARDYWILDFEHVIFCEERRQNFRHHVSATGFVRRSYTPDKDTKYPCQLRDISATGVLFRCRELFASGEALELSFSSLRPNGPSYCLPCEVRRRLDGAEFSYGCAFLPLTSRVEQQLYQDLFALQSQDISRRPKR